MGRPEASATTGRPETPIRTGRPETRTRSGRPEKLVRTGRPEKPLPDPGSALGHLALFLRTGRKRRDLTYAKMAALPSVIYSASTLQRAASGTTLPERSVARSYAHACALDVDEVDRLWLQARREQRTRRGERRETPPRPHI